MKKFSETPIKEMVNDNLFEGRKLGTGFVEWVLENIYGLDRDSARESVCDNSGDKGIDAIVCDSIGNKILIFQGKVSENPASSSLGDRFLREFVGTLERIKNPDEIENVKLGANSELRGLIEELNIEEKIRSGWLIEGVFITNLSKDENANNYLNHTSISALMTVLDCKDLDQRYVDAAAGEVIAGTTTLSYGEKGCLELLVDKDVKVAFAPVLARDLVKLDGIESGALFDLNVRQSLGRTKVNKAIEKTINDKSEHGKFLLFHNGITFVCDKFENRRHDNQIEISGYAVVNGCQSISSLFNHKDKLTNDLYVLCRIVQVGPDHNLVRTITERSNNQNGVTPRDFRSSDQTQIRLQKQITEISDGAIFYYIKRGEKFPEEAEVIDNELAARWFRAFDLDAAYNTHQKSDVFESAYNDIFSRPGVNGHRIIALSLIWDAIKSRLHNIEDPLVRALSLPHFFLMSVVKEMLVLDKDVGDKLVKNPDKFDLCSPDERSDICSALGMLVENAIVDFNAEIVDQREKMKDSFDAKRIFKNQSLSKEMLKTINNGYQKDLKRKKSELFSTLLKEVRTSSSKN